MGVAVRMIRSSVGGAGLVLMVLTGLLGSAASDARTQADPIVFDGTIGGEDLKGKSPPFGNNTYVITVRKSDANSRALRTISDLVAVSGPLRAGFTAEFSERPDG